MRDNMLPYVPDELPLSNLDYRLLLPLVGQANAALARYDGLLQSIPNPGFQRLINLADGHEVI